MSHRLGPGCGDRSHLKTLAVAGGPDLPAIDLSSTLTDRAERRSRDASDRPIDEAPAGGTVESFDEAVGSAPAWWTFTCTMPSQMPIQSLSALCRPSLSLRPLPGVGGVGAVHIQPVGAR